MKAIIATNQGGLEDNVFPTFGRCPTYTIMEIEDGKIKETKIEPNQAATMAGGAGIAAAQFIVDSKADAVIVGNIGPNAVGVLKQGGVKIYSAPNMKVKDAVQQLIEGKLQELEAPTVGPYGTKPGAGMGRGRGMGPGGGRGRGFQ